MKNGSASKIDPYREVVVALLAQTPTITNLGMLRRLKEKGYDGSVRPVTDLLNQLRPAPGRVGRPSNIKTYTALVAGILTKEPDIRLRHLLQRIQAKGYTGSKPPLCRLVKKLQPDKRKRCRYCKELFVANWKETHRLQFCSTEHKTAFFTEQRALMPGQGLCYTCGAPTDNRICDDCRESKNENQQRHRQADRREAITHYGGKCTCPGCGESNIEFLAFDHVDNDGSKHRRELNAGQRRNFARWLKQNNWPTNIRLLCHNCNCARGYYGYCPHERMN